MYGARVDDGRFRRGQAIVWRSVGVDGTVGRAWPMTVELDSHELIALYLGAGTIFKAAAESTRPWQRQAAVAFDGHHYDLVWRGIDALILYRPGEAHCVWRFQRAEDQTMKMWYVNLEAPWRRTPRGFDSRDHSLDVVVAPDRSSWSWKDENEIEREIAAGRLTTAEAAQYRREGQRAAQRILRGEPPFDQDWTAWRPDPVWTIPSLPPDWDR